MHVCSLAYWVRSKLSGFCGFEVNGRCHCKNLKIITNFQYFSSRCLAYLSSAPFCCTFFSTSLAVNKSEIFY
uniref:Putative ovule protein n=1 Tax=Solanum chacoense TaxID=4108 RepID=A0A0V0H982_SOLCH